MELAASLGFLVFGLAYFSRGMRDIEESKDKEYNRTLNEKREFGYRGPTEPQPLRQENHK
jgi:hypothetical protein